MDIYRLIHILIRKVKYIFLIPLLAGILMYLISSNQQRSFIAKASIFTAITSNSSLDNLGNSRVDYFATKTAYNNLLSILSSRSVIEETSLRLFANHLMLEEANPIEISKLSYNELQSIIPPEVNDLVVKNNIEKTYNNLLEYMQQDKNNFLYGLLNFDHPHYSFKAISSNVKISQVGSSDIVELKYELDDPGIVFQTLNILIEVFLKEYSVLKKSQTNAVVEYFEQQLDQSSTQLNSVEDKLLSFNKANNIVNYYEQTKHISSQQEKIEVKLQDMLMEYQSAEAVLKKLEIETHERYKININTKDILDIRKSLIAVKQKLVKIEMEKINLEFTPQLEIELKELERDLQLDLHGKIDSLYIYERNTEGVTIETLLHSWLNTVIEYEGARARLLAMQTKSKEFVKLYAQFAPLGATLKRIEREIDVKEKEYLEILHHLGLAKLKQQNEEMMANMKILDRPQLPIDPEPTKRKIFILIIVFFSFIFTLLGIVVFELLDRTIKTPKRLEEKLKLKVAGAYAYEKPYKGIELDLINKVALKSIIELILNLRNQNSSQAVIVQFISFWQAEGKSFIIQALAAKLRNIGYSTTILDFAENVQSTNMNSNPWLKQIGDAKSYNDLIRNNSIGSDIVLIEVPAVSNQVFNTALLKTASLSYLITDAQRCWTSADDFLINNYKEQITQNLEGILNNVHPEDMVGIIGEIPKKRSWLRKIVKTIVFGKSRSEKKVHHTAKKNNSD
jgi:polysaccharide biosynthesis transport protein